MISIEHLTKKYGSHVAVNDLNIIVEDGKIYGFLGPNGAGKSTTMNIMTGYLAATEGKVVINNHDIFEEPEEAKKLIGYLPEFPPLYTDMTPREYLLFVSDLKKVDKRKRKLMVNEIIKETGIEDVSDRLIKHLSKGYRQRVGIAQALIGFPPVLILDEPTVGLDPSQIIEMRELIKKLGEKHTIILSSHILSEVSAVCDYVWIINKGTLAAAGKPEDLSAHINNGVFLEVEIKGNKDAFIQLLDSQDYIISYKISDDDEETVKAVIQVKEEDKDIEESFFYLCADKRMPIISLKKEERSLEDVFLAFTHEREEV